MKLLHKRRAVALGERAHQWEIREAHVAAAGKALGSVITADNQFWIITLLWKISHALGDKRLYSSVFGFVGDSSKARCFPLFQMVVTKK